MSKVQDVRKSSLTFAPEAGSQRLRNVINKGLTKDDILNGAGMAFEGGWQKVKLYFMLGLPTETEEDMRAIPELANEIAARYYEIPKDKRNGKCQITMSTSFFVPKPFTPFQWAPMYEKGEYLRRAKIVNDTMKEQLNHKSLRYNWHEADVTVLEDFLPEATADLPKPFTKPMKKAVCLMPGRIILMSINGMRSWSETVSLLISMSIASVLWMKFCHGILLMLVCARNFCTRMEACDHRSGGNTKL